MGKCYICGRYLTLERHHVFGGARRSISEKYGAVAELCHYCHNEPPNGVHFNKANRLALQSEFQRKLMRENNWTVEDFIQIFSKSYI